VTVIITAHAGMAPLRSRGGLMQRNARSVTALTMISAASLLCVACGDDPAPRAPVPHTLSAREVYDVGAVDAAKLAHYYITSAVCELESPRPYLPENGIFGGRLFFHGFRVRASRAPAGSTEQVVLFASNHPASAGSGITITVNTEAFALDPVLPQGSTLREPITMQTPGAQETLACAQQAGPPPKLELRDHDAEAWRQQAIARYGPEKTNRDGSKDDYVQLALVMCKTPAAQQAAILAKEGKRKRPSLNRHIFEGFCPFL
jgi:hypothetical protein